MQLIKKKADVSAQAGTSVTLERPGESPKVISIVSITKDLSADLQRQGSEAIFPLPADLDGDGDGDGGTPPFTPPNCARTHRWVFCSHTLH